MANKRAIDSSSPSNEKSTLCLEWIQLNDSYRVRGIQSIASHFQNFCRESRFIDHCSALGFKEPRFSLNPYLKNGWCGFEKFARCLEREVSVAGVDERSSLSSQLLGLVFHGSQQSNITSILQKGLNAELRKGQAYGPGEYFSTTPTTSISYCRGGKQIVIFVVILPETRNTGTTMTTKPADVIVVNNNEHHLAIGTLDFQEVDQQVVFASDAKRKAFLKLSQEAMAQERIKKEAETKALIMKHLIANKIDFASEVYLRNGGILGDLSKREIAWYANSKLDEDVVEAYFPSLPEAIESSKLGEVDILSADEAEQNVHEAVTKLQQAKQEYFGELGGHLLN